MDPYHFQNMHDRRFPVHPQPYPPTLGEGRRGGGRRRPGTKLSTDPQSVAARERRHRISDRFRVLRSLVPGGSKMDTVSMLEQAIHYVKFLKAQISLHQAALMQHEERDHGLSAFTNGGDHLMLPNQQAQVLLDPADSGSHELPPLPACLLLDEPAAASYSSMSALQDEETDVHGSY